MTLPRQVVPDSDYMITRRCSERRFFLRPDDETNNAFLYCLGLAARRANVEVTFSEAMSNHHHTGIHDPEGNYPVFTEHFHGLLARCQNARLGHFENFWSSEPTSVVRLVEPNDVLDKMVYAITNPCAADLVDRAEDWPGVSTYLASLTTGWLVAARPKHFFREKGAMPEVISIRIRRPSGFDHLTQAQWAELLTERVLEKEAEYRRRRAQLGISVLGRAGILAQDPFAAPKSKASHFELSPRVAAKSKWARIEALLRNRDFLARYRAAFLGHLAGIARVLFPFGTYWMRKFAKVACEPDDVPGLPLAAPAQS